MDYFLDKLVKNPWGVRTELDGNIFRSAKSLSPNLWQAVAHDRFYRASQPVLSRLELKLNSSLYIDLKLWIVTNWVMELNSSLYIDLKLWIVTNWVMDIFGKSCIANKLRINWHSWVSQEYFDDQEYSCFWKKNSRFCKTTEQIRHFSRRP